MTLFKNTVTALTLLRAFVSLVRDPNQTEMVFDMVKGLSDEEHLQEMMDAVAVESHAADALATRPRLEPIDLQAMAQLPQGTLGRAFADHMLSEGLDVDFFPEQPSGTPDEFLLAHLYEVHDIWHVVTGFGTDVAGELGLQAFGAAQFPSKVGVMILSAGLLNTIVTGWGDRDRRLEAITRGWLLGRQARLLFGTRWDTLWETPLVQVRAGFGLPADPQVAAATRPLLALQAAVA